MSRKAASAKKSASKPRKPKLSVAEQYIEDVCAGRIVVSKYVKLACERHQRDLQHGHERGLVFDREAAQHFIDFFPAFLRHTEGEYDGEPFHLHPSQQAKWWIAYGWYWKDTGYRRWKFIYNEESRGNGKSAQASGWCAYELLGSGERGAQVYTAGPDKKTAKLVFDTAALMINNSPPLKRRVKVHLNNMYIPGTASKMEPCAADSDNLMGLRPSAFSLDELHVHSNGRVLAAFRSAQGKRPNSLGLAITNSGWDRNSICYQEREYACKVLEGIFDDDTYMGWIAGIDDEDDWEDESCWIKANPLLGTIVRIEELRDAAKLAKQNPAQRDDFLRFRLSRWTTGHSKWMPLPKWDGCLEVVDPDELRGEPCFGALDLSTTTDISSFIMLFPPREERGIWRVLPRFYLPKESIAERVKNDRVPYDLWEREGLFILTEGSVIDYEAIRKDINEQREFFDVRDISFDRWNSSEIVRNLENDGHEMVKWGQGFQDMNPGTKRLMELVLNGQFAHGGNKVLRWMVSNVIVQKDAAGNVKPDKAKSKEKIDGIVAIIMALGRAMLAGEVFYAGSEVEII